MNRVGEYLAGKRAGGGGILIYAMGLIRELYALQERTGWLSPDVLRDLAARQRVPLYRLQGLVSFYPHFRTEPPPRAEVAICRDLSCHLRGSAALAAAVRAELADELGVAIDEVSCLGRCDGAPAAVVSDCPLAPAGVETIVRRVRDLSPPETPTEEQVAPSRRFRIDPYHPSPGHHTGDPLGVVSDAGVPDSHYGVLAGDPAPDRVIQALHESGLRGMGGAGFPAGEKWALVRRETRTPKYVICNADESEPGTFKDRVLLQEAPHLVLEGIALAGRTVGAERGIVYIRHEYAAERRALERELDVATAAGKLRGFPIEIFVSPGGYILGEETALLQALEDERGEPRNKPPFPGTHGLWGQPTLINNVETLAVTPGIVARGGAWWKAQGLRGAAGLKLMAVSGDVERPGVYEIPMGTTVAELIGMAGGVAGGRKLLAFVPGGVSSSFLPADKADVPLDHAALLQAGSMLGSGALVVLAEGRDLWDVAQNVTRFFARESCGKCVPCRMGTEKAVQLLDSLVADPAARQQSAARRAAETRLAELHETLRLTSICGLGQAALGPALSLLRTKD
ncbi:MAG: NAD(P)H-dependent oxidoreductase subunit E [Chloroflexi bacterium]|nr:NAD(P)H-dependent oxidoreductase subunit E [Chloroflexota bacterium]